MKLSVFVLLITISLCFARSKYSFGYSRFWDEIERFDDEPADAATVGLAEALTEAPTEELTEAPTEEAKGVTTAEEPNQTAQRAAWFFDGEWNEEVEGNLTAGKDVLIVYDASRLPGRATKYGQRVWDIFVEYKFSEHGAVHSEKLDGPNLVGGIEIMNKSIFIPFGTKKLTVWFKHWDYYNGYSYDSDYGKNYHEDVAEPSKPTIVFDSGAETVYGELEAGQQFVVYYDSKRLNGDGDRFAVAKFDEDSDDIYTHELNNPVAGSDYLRALYFIPDDALEVIMWFYIEEDDARQYDSDYGRNYVFPLN